MLYNDLYTLIPDSNRHWCSSWRRELFLFLDMFMYSYPCPKRIKRCNISVYHMRVRCKSHLLPKGIKRVNSNLRDSLCSQICYPISVIWIFTNQFEYIFAVFIYILNSTQWSTGLHTYYHHSKNRIAFYQSWLPD